MTVIVTSLWWTESSVRRISPQPSAATGDACASDNWPVLCAEHKAWNSRDRHDIVWVHNDVGGGLVTAASRASRRIIRSAERLLSKWAVPSWQTLRHLDFSLPRPSDVAGTMLHAFIVVLSTPLYRLR